MWIDFSMTSLENQLEIAWDSGVNHQSCIHLMGWNLTVKPSSDIKFDKNYVLVGHLAAKRIMTDCKTGNRITFAISMDWIPKNYTSSMKLVKNPKLRIVVGQKYNIRCNSRAVDRDYQKWKKSDEIHFKFVSDDLKYTFEHICELRTLTKHVVPVPPTMPVLDYFKDVPIAENTIKENPIPHDDDAHDEIDTNHVVVEPDSESESDEMIGFPPAVNVVDVPAMASISNTIMVSDISVVSNTSVEKKRKRNDDLIDELNAKKEKTMSDIKQLQELSEDNQKKMIQAQEYINKRLQKFGDIKKHLARMIEQQRLLDITISNLVESNI